MKRRAMFAFMLVAMLAQPAFAWGPPWSSQGAAQGVGCVACLLDGYPLAAGTGTVQGSGVQLPLLNGTGPGPGDGTQPMPLNGQGFGSPWTK